MRHLCCVIKQHSSYTNITNFKDIIEKIGSVNRKSRYGKIKIIINDARATFENFGNLFVVNMIRTRSSGIDNYVRVTFNTVWVLGIFSF